MKSLHPLLKNLSKNEVRLLRAYLASKALDSNNDKRLILLDVVLKNKNQDDRTVARMVGYTGSHEKSYINLKSRLRNDVLDMLMLQERGGAFETAFAQAAFDCRKMLMQGEMLLSRGVYDLGAELLEKSLTLARQYELHSEFIAIADVLRNHAAAAGDLDAFAGLSELMDEAQSSLSRVLRAKQMHYEIVLPGLMKADTISSYREQGNTLLSRLESQGKRSTSSRIAFYHHLSALNFYSNLHEFPEALRFGKKLLKQVTEDPLMSSDANCAGVNMELAGVCLNTGDYESAVLHAGKAVEMFRSGMVNQLQAMIILFFAHFRNGDCDQAETVLNKAFAHRQSDADPLLRSRLHLMQSALHYCRRELKHCVSHLSESQPLVKSRDVWFPGVFLLQSLTDIERESYHTVGPGLSVFRKLAAQAGIGSDRRYSRLAPITQVIAAVSRCRDVSEAVKKESERIEMLQQAQGDYYWNPAGYELIRFDEWILRKAS